MNDRCSRIAQRIAALLEQQLGTGVDAARMLAEPLYRRDVLLVCDAHRGHELADLARWFRRSAAASPAGAAERPSGFGYDSIFSSSASGTSSTWGPDSQPGSSGAMPLPSPAELVRQQLEQQRAAARRGGELAVRTVAGR